MNSAEHNSNAQDYCANKAIPDGSNLYYASLFENIENKQILISLHAFLCELTEIIHECSDPGVARIKLHWWQEEIERLFNQQARHPVTKQFAEHLSLNEKLENSFKSIIGNFDQFLFIDQMGRLDDVLALYDSTAGEVWQRCGIQTQAESTNSLVSLRMMGTIYQFINCLQEPNTYITETRCIIPENIVPQESLLKLRSNIQTQSNEQQVVFAPLMQDLINRLEHLHTNLKTEQPIFKHALILNRIALKTCIEIYNDGCRLLNTKTSLTPLRKLWIAWWTNIKV